LTKDEKEGKQRLMVTTRVGLAQDQPNRPLKIDSKTIPTIASSRLSGGETDDKVFEQYSKGKVTP